MNYSIRFQCFTYLNPNNRYNKHYNIAKKQYSAQVVYIVCLLFFFQFTYQDIDDCVRSTAVVNFEDSESTYSSHKGN